MKELFEQLLHQTQSNIQEIEEMTSDDFNPCDASGGNFDDAYDLGWQHGYEYGKRAALSQLFSEFF